MLKALRRKSFEQWHIEISFNVFECTYNVPLELEKGKKGKCRPCTYNTLAVLCLYYNINITMHINLTVASPDI